MKTKLSEVKRVLNEVVSLLNREGVTHMTFDSQRASGEIDIIVLYTARVTPSSATPSGHDGGSGSGAGSEGV